MNESLTLRELLSFVVDNRGRTCPVSETGLPLIATNCVKSGTLYPVFEKVRYIDNETYENWFRAHPEPGDLIFVLKGSPGQVCMTPNPVNFCIAQDMVALRVNPLKVYPPYLFAALRSETIQDEIANLHVGSLIPHFKKGDFDRLTIPLPSPDAQKEIGDFYLRVSEKMENNQRASATLEAMARALYRSWFVDFDPVWAKVEHRPPAHMPPQTAALFPDSFDDEGLPLGWELVPYLDFVEIISGGTPKTTEPSYWNGDIPWYSVVDAPPSGQVFVHGTEKTISAAGFQASAVKLVPRGTTIISARGTVGKLAIAGQDMVFNQSCYGLRGRTEQLDAFVYFATERAIEQLQSMAHGSVFATITRKTFEGLDMPRATPPVLRAFEAVCAEMLSRIHSFGCENQTLATLRDSLLPRLMSGELRVGDARAQVEEVA